MALRVSLRWSGKIRKIESEIQLKMPRNRNHTLHLTGTFSPICIDRNGTLSVGPAVETKPTGRFLLSE